MRLRTLPLSVSGIILGSAIAYYQDFWNPKIFSLALLTTILFQVLSNLANDLGDGIKGTDNENRIGPERAIQSGAISQKQMIVAIIICVVLGLTSAALLIYFSAEGMTKQTLWIYIGLAILSTIAAVTYTIGKKAYGYHGLGDLMVLIFFGFVSVLGVYTLFSHIFLLDNILPAICIGLLSTAVLNLNNMRDYHNDVESNKITLVVKMGPNQAKLYHALIILVGLLSMAVFISKMNNPIYFVSLVPGLYLLYHLRVVMQTADPADFDPELKKVALATFSISILFFAAVLIDKFWMIS